MRMRALPGPTSRGVLLLLGGCVAAVAPAGAQEVVARRDGLFQPSIAAEGSYLETRSRPTDNGREGILRLSPGLRWSSRSGLIQGDADYVGDLILRRGIGATEGTDFQNALNAHVLAEAVRGRVGVEGRASISQQALSAFGEQSVAGSPTIGDKNRSEVATVSVSPYVRGSLAGVADYDLRLGVSRSKVRSEEIPDSRASDFQFTLTSPRGNRLGWDLLAQQRRVETELADGRPDAAENARVRLSGNMTVMPQLQLSAGGGAETIDEGADASRRTSKTANLGLQWAPSVRTQLLAEIEKRHFGTGGRVNFTHRGPQTVLTYAYVRDTTFGLDGTSLSRPTTLFQLGLVQAASQFPDPVERQQAVLADLLNRGLDPRQVVTVPVIGPAFSLQRRQDISFAWLGRRISLNLQAFSTSTSQFVTPVGEESVTDEPVRQQGWTSALSYRLTPYTAVTLGGQRRMTKASTAGAANDLKSADLGLTSQIGRRTTARVAARYTVFNSPTDPYRATSVSASISQRY